MRSRAARRPKWAVLPLSVKISPKQEGASDIDVDVYSVEPEASLTHKLDAGAHIAIVWPASHVTPRRAKRFSSAPDLLVLVRDLPTADQPHKSQPVQNAGLALGLALRAMPLYARQEFQDEATAIVEEGRVDRVGSWLRRTAWATRNVIDVVCSGVRLRLRSKPLYCATIWRTPDPDPDVAEHLTQRLEALLR